MITPHTAFKYPEEVFQTIGEEGGLQLDYLPSGQLMSLFLGDVLLSRTVGNALEGGLARMYLRVHTSEGILVHPVLGPNSLLSSFASTERGLYWKGDVAGLEVDLSLNLLSAEKVFVWSLGVKNKTGKPQRVDCVWGQDIGLADRGALSNNEAYVSHYVDQSVINRESGNPCICYRQNLAQSGEKYPWIMLSCLSGAQSYATDAFDVFGNAYRGGELPEGLFAENLANRCRQYEFAFGALQSEPLVLETDEHTQIKFAALYRDNHEEPTTEKDVESLSLLKECALALETESPDYSEISASNLFQTSEYFPCRDLGRDEIEKLYGEELRHLELKEGRVLSFFADQDVHVVTREKELLVDRPHGSILLGGKTPEWRDDTLTTTMYAGGMFNGHISVGNTSFHRILTLPREPLGLSRSAGQRIFVGTKKGWKLLGVPSLYEISRDYCCWYYMGDAGERISVRVSLDREADRIELAVNMDRPMRLIISNEIMMGSHESELEASMSCVKGERSVRVCSTSDNLAKQKGFALSFAMRWDQATKVEKVGGGELLSLSHAGAPGTNVLTLKTAPLTAANFSMAASLSGAEGVNEKLYAKAGAEGDRYWSSMHRNLRLKHAKEDVTRLDDALQWFSHNAMIHYASPHGLEQYTGAAWGTRDACQGPFEYFLSQQRFDLARDILIKTFSRQYADSGNWPQWFMLDEYGDVAQEHSHGDIVVWPLKALALYLAHSGDLAVLSETVSYFGGVESESIEAHVSRALDRIESEFIPGTSLIRYGDGDWDDSLQPADPILRSRLVSSWTVALLAQMLKEMDKVLALTSYDKLHGRVSRMEKGVSADYRKYVLRDGVVSGFLLFDEKFENARPMLHPSDQDTGIHYRLIPMTRSILAGLLSREEADEQMDLIAKHLKFPDGVRLMEKPAVYNGGVETFFRRAESAANFGREIGLQYVHAHIRYAEALAQLGNADALLEALMVICPVGIEHAVPNAKLRQSNAYFSSSDGDFMTRYEAAERYDSLKSGDIGVKGGWRIYSSGPGLYSALVIQKQLGLSMHEKVWHIDPVLPSTLDGLKVEWEMEGKPVTVEYVIKKGASAPQSIELNGQALDGTRCDNPYREGGLSVDREALKSALKGEDNVLTVKM